MRTTDDGTPRAPRTVPKTVPPASLPSNDDLYAATAKSYARVRRGDPRIGAQLREAIGSATSVLNVGAGAGSYETDAGVTVAVDPSLPMVRRRATTAAPIVRGVAEGLPFASNSVDVVISTLSIQHWKNLSQGLAELRRVARTRIVLLTWDSSFSRHYWLTRDYLPRMLTSWDARRFPDLESLRNRLPGAEVTAVPIPHDCTDGFMAAYWRRPEAYLDPHVRAGISALAAWEGSLAGVWRRLESDLRSGAWVARNGHLVNLDTLDVGYRIISAPASTD